jgi:membrane protein implicated in regulation of membrane protease activity
VATATIIFLILGGLGVAVLTLALLGAEVLHFGHPDLDGPVTLEMIAGCLGALGFGGAVASELLHARTPGLIAAAAGVGALAAVPTGWLVARLSRAARNMHTDHTPSRRDLIGAIGVVVSPIPAAGYGEVRVGVVGQPVKLNAKADRPIPAGTQIFVIEALSETSVLVEATPLIR